jgi:ABC-type multidrug transport system fused ATPase/permease subunit
MKKRILLLDEATANIDPVSDATIQEVIKGTFTYQTVLIIAHRIQTIMHCDKVLVLEKGEIVEFESPTKLMEDSESYFYSFANGLSTKGKNKRLNVHVEEI